MAFDPISAAISGGLGLASAFMGSNAASSAGKAQAAALDRATAAQVAQAAQTRADLAPFLKRPVTAWRKDVAAWRKENFDAQRASAKELFVKAKALVAKASGTRSWLYGLWGVPGRELWAVGAYGVILRHAL